jgi:hypothetical protein
LNTLIVILSKLKPAITTLKPMQSASLQQVAELLKRHNALPADDTSIETLFNQTLELVVGANVKAKTKANAKAKAPHPAPEDATKLDENDRIMSAYHVHEQQKREKWRSKMPQLGISEEGWDEIYNAAISHHQANMQANGAFFEKHVEDMLHANSIPFKRQVTIDANGNVIGFGIKDKCNHILDIVVGTDIEIGKHISEFPCVLSLKTSARERWNQDQKWSFVHAPKLFIFLTMNDPPPAERFQESDTRKIMTCEPKKKDDRKFKLSLNDLISLLRSLL